MFWRETSVYRDLLPRVAAVLRDIPTALANGVAAARTGVARHPASAAPDRGGHGAVEPPVGRHVGRPVGPHHQHTAAPGRHVGHCPRPRPRRVEPAGPTP